MNSIIVSEIRIAGFRGIENISLPLSKTTVLTGCNNAGKTTILKALQLALGHSNFLTQDDLFISKNGNKTNEIIVDIKIIPVDEQGKQVQEFGDDWEADVFKTYIAFDSLGNAFSAFRTKYTYSMVKSDFDKEIGFLSQWNPSEGNLWQAIPVKSMKVDRDSFPFFYIETQRDIVADIKIHNSFLGKLLSEVAKAYSPEIIEDIESRIKALNEETISKSPILTKLQVSLKELESTVDDNNSEIAITPFTKKIRDLNKGVSIQYGNRENSFSMEYHGMGTRSWTSLLTFKAFVLQHKFVTESKGKLFSPIITIEEPEAHLHPDAQKRLFSQITDMPGQKIISTHSPYIAACADLSELRNIYKKNEKIQVGKIDISLLSPEDKRKLRLKVINTHGDILFAKALVFFEGDTEEQALPIFADSFFSNSYISLGINFIGVGGNGKYKPFILLAEAMNIPWYIFSDGEVATKRKVLETLNDTLDKQEEELSSFSNVFVIKDNANYEQMLINENYLEEVERAIVSLLGESCLQKYIDQHNKEFNNYLLKEKDDDRKHIIFSNLSPEGKNKAIEGIMKKHKVQLAPIVAENICSCSRGIPSLIKEMFEKIKGDLSL